MKRWVPLVIVFGLAVSVHAWANEWYTGGGRQQTFAMAIPETPDLHDFSQNDYSSEEIAQLFLSGLVRLRDGRIEMEMADYVEVAVDQSVYTFYLKEAKWSDGTRVTASDFEYAWVQGLRDKQDADLFFIKGAEEFAKGTLSRAELGIHVENDTTLVVEVLEGGDEVLARFADPSFFPIHPEGIPFLGNGPFHLEELNDPNYYVFERNSQYWNQEAVRLERIEVYVEDPATALLMYETNIVDYIHLDPSRLKEFVSSPELHHVSPSQYRLLQPYVKNAQFSAYHRGGIYAPTDDQVYALDVTESFIEGKE